MIMTFVPRAVIAYSGFERIQSYLLYDHGRGRPLATTKMSIHESIAETPTLAIELAGVSIPGTEDFRPILSDISFRISRGSVVICTGPVGSGKVSSLIT